MACASVLALGLAATTACGTTAEEAEPLGDLAVDDVYQRMLEGTQRPDAVVYTRIETVGSSEGESYEMYTKDLWIDGGTETVREELHMNPDLDWPEMDDESVAVYVGQYVYRPDDPGEALRDEVEDFCRESDSVVVARLLQCGAFSLHQGDQIDPGRKPTVDTAAEYEGQEAVAIVYAAGESATEYDVTLDSRVYIDRETFLPIAYVTEMRDEEHVSIFLSTYEHEFVPRDSLADGFVDPRSIGYGVEDASQQLDRMESEVPVYWLGEDVELEGAEDLVLVGIETELAFPPDEVPYYQDSVYGRHLYYETPFGVAAIYIFLWTPAEWQRYLATPQGQFLSDAVCAPSEPISVGGTDGLLYDLVDWRAPIAVDNPRTDQERCEKKIHELWLIPYDRIAVLEFEDAVVDVRSDVAGYFDERSQFEAVLAALRRR